MNSGWDIKRYTVKQLNSEGHQRVIGVAARFPNDHYAYMVLGGQVVKPYYSETVLRKSLGDIVLVECPDR